MRVAVIGAGASGLVAAKYLADQGHNVVIFESSDKIGGTFVNKVYDETALVSSKTLTAFSDLRMGEDIPDHPSAEHYVAYLQQYKQTFLDTSKLIEFRFQTRVVEILRKNSPQEPYSVASSSTLAGEKDETFHAVAICSGLHNVPKIPAEEELPGIGAFKADPNTICIHSSEYKEKSIFQNRNVLILGCGETAMDITKRAVLGQANSIGIVVREGFLSIPHLMAEEKPLDVFITNLFEHSYEHPWVHFLQLRWKLSTFVIRLGLLLVGGSSWGFGQWACRVSEVKRGFHIINKAHGALPNINKGQRLKELKLSQERGEKKPLLAALWERFWASVERKGVMTLGLAGGEGEKDQGVMPVTPYNTQVASIRKGSEGGKGWTVTFRNGEKVEGVDTIVMATGYKQEFPFLQRYRSELNETLGLKDEEERERKRKEEDACCFRHSQGDDYLPSEHFITDPRDPRVAFIGFARPNVGAIPPQSEMQVQWWLQRACLCGAPGGGGAGGGGGVVEKQKDVVKEGGGSAWFRSPDKDDYVRGWMTAPHPRTAEVHFWKEVLASFPRGFTNLLNAVRGIHATAAVDDSASTSSSSSSSSSSSLSVDRPLQTGK